MLDIHNEEILILPVQKELILIIDIERSTLHLCTNVLLLQYYTSCMNEEPRSVKITSRSHTRVMDYDEACFMHLPPGVVHNFPKAVGV